MDYLNEKHEKLKKMHALISDYLMTQVPLTIMPILDRTDLGDNLRDEIQNLLEMNFDMMSKFRNLMEKEDP